MLSTGMGGIDWGGLPIVVELLGVEDVERLVRQMMVIRSNNSKANNDGSGNPLD